MKKVLLGTTALIAATAITAPAMSAERIQLQLRGYHVGGISYTDMDGTSNFYDLVDPLNDTSGDLFSGDYNNINFGSDSEVHFRGATTLDNGLRVSFKAELELEDDADVDGDADAIDEVYVQFDGGFGRIQFGQNDGVMDQMAVVAPLIFAEHAHSDPDLDPFDPWGWDNPIDTVGDFSGDDIKITYFTPEMNGFQLGFSFTPNPCKNDTGYSDCIDDEYARNYWEVSATFEADLDNVSLGFSGGYGTGESGSAYETPREWTLGAEIGFGGFTLGGSYKDSQTLGDNVANQDDTSFDVGAAYETGPWAFNVAYGQREWSGRADDDNIFDNPTEIHFDNEAESWVAGVTYMYGPGMQIGLGVTTIDGEARTADVLVDEYATLEEFDGTSVFIENVIKF